MKSKKLLFTILSLLVIQVAYSQPRKLWGINTSGGIPPAGQLGAGNIYTVNSNDSNFTQHHCFINTYPGATPYGNVIQANDGKLYGMTQYGGSAFSGTIFSYDTATSIFQRRVNFDDNDTSNPAQMNIASNPIGNLTQASNGKLYGLTLYGGLLNYGTLFSFDPATDSLVVLVNFNDGTNDAETPFGSLVAANDGKLYGTASGGSMGAGLIFSFDPATDTYTKLMDFNDGTNDAAGPPGSLIQASNGLLFGMTTAGGINNMGVIYNFDPALNVYTKLYDFDLTNGANPLFSSLVEGSNNTLYGMTSSGGSNFDGVLFSFDFLFNTFTRLTDFDGVSKGAIPFGSLILASDGLLYGMTEEGGQHNLGVAFSFDPVPNTFVKLFDFNGRFNGANPWGDFFQATNGKLYGLAGAGGSGLVSGDPAGVFFSYETGSGTYTKLLDFNTGIDGNNPTGKMVRASNANFYGTSAGGDAGFGLLFSLNTTTNVYTIVHQFDFTNGADPTGSLIQATDGKLYGTTASGGNDSSGTIFSFDPSSSAFTKLYDFDNAHHGSVPNGDLLQATNGLLYGLTNAGGDSSYGVLYSFNASTSAFLKLVDFDGTLKGAKPQGGLVQANNGKLYGLTEAGGIYNGPYNSDNGSGVLFSYDPSTSTYTKLHDFGDTLISDGAVTPGSLLKASNGMFYGTSVTGGSDGSGIMFQFDPTTNSYSNLYDFTGIFWKPWGDLMQASNGKIYGPTSDTYTGSYFEFDPVGLTFYFDSTFTGGVPAVTSGLLEIPSGVGFITASSNNKHQINLFPNPSNGKITVSFENTVDVSSIKVYNFLGEEVYSEKCSGVYIRKEISLHVPPGVYFVKAGDGEKQMTEKFVIQ